MCGPEQQVILHMHDREAAAQNLSAVQMELDDLASDSYSVRPPALEMTVYSTIAAMQQATLPAMYVLARLVQTLGILHQSDI